MASAIKRISTIFFIMMLFITMFSLVYKDPAYADSSAPFSTSVNINGHFNSINPPPLSGSSSTSVNLPSGSAEDYIQVNTSLNAYEQYPDAGTGTFPITVSVTDNSNDNFSSADLYVSASEPPWSQYGTVDASGSQTLVSNATTFNLNLSYVVNPNSIYCPDIVSLQAGLSGNVFYVAPPNLTYSGLTANSVTLSWNNPGSNNYRIYENGALFTTVSNTTSYTVTGLTSGVSYSFYVTAEAPQSGNWTGASNTVNITTQLYVTSLTISPSSVNMSTNSSYGQLQVTASYSNGTVQNVTSSCSWSPLNGNIAFIMGAGDLYSGNIPGTVTVTASYGGQSASCTVTVSNSNPIYITGLTISPTSVSMNTNFYYGILQATAYYSDGSSKSVTGSCSWSPTNGSIAYISGAGNLYSGSTPGTVTITASYDGQSASCTVTVSNPNPVYITSIGISPSSISMYTNSSYNQFQVTAYYSNGSTQSVTASCSWVSSNNSIVQIIGAGNLQSGSTAGTATITASYDGFSASCTVTVSSNSTGSSGSLTNPIVSIQLDGGQSTTTSNIVNIAITASGYNILSNATMLVGYASGSNGTSPTWSGSWVPFADSTTIALPNTTGLYTISVQVRDSNGNIGQANAEITLQQPSEQTTSGPITIQVTGLNGADSTSTGSIELHVAVTGGTGPYQYSVNNSSFSQLPSTGYITVPISNGPNQENITVEDSNGQIANSSIIIWGIF